MPRIPAYCKKCNLIFPSVISVEKNGSINITGATTNCPICGSYSPILDGFYNVIDESINLIKGSQFSKQKLREYKNIFKNLKSEKATYKNVKP